MEKAAIVHRVRFPIEQLGLDEELRMSEASCRSRREAARRRRHVAPHSHRHNISERAKDLSSPHPSASARFASSPLCHDSRLFLTHRRSTSRRTCTATATPSPPRRSRSPVVPGCQRSTVNGASGDGEAGEPQAPKLLPAAPGLPLPHHLSPAIAALRRRRPHPSALSLYLAFSLSATR